MAFLARCHSSPRFSLKVSIRRSKNWPSKATQALDCQLKLIREQVTKLRPTRQRAEGPINLSASLRQVVPILVPCRNLTYGLFALLLGVNANVACEFPNGFPDDPGFFPIGVWNQSPARAPAYKAIGINTFVGLWNGPTEIQLAALTKSNMFVVASQNDVGLHSINRGIIKAWLHDDEPDNAQPIGMGLYGSCIPASDVARRTKEIKARDNTRPVMINFGQGLANEYWRGRGPCSGDQNYYSVAARDVDILSFDIYPVASEIPQVKGKLEYVARGVSRLMALTTNCQRAWAVIETTALDPGHGVNPAQLRAEVWMAIIHGARGIVYFVHEFAPRFREDAIFQYPRVVSQVAEENRLITSLAEVLNSRISSETISLQSSTAIATLVKRYKDKIYIFAVAMNNSVSKARFTLQTFNGSEVTVLGENRNLEIKGGGFEDAFAGYDVHIYKVPLIEKKS